jgi:hypothetical protein
MRLKDCRPLTAETVRPFGEARSVGPVRKRVASQFPAENRWGDQRPAQSR